MDGPIDALGQLIEGEFSSLCDELEVCRIDILLMGKKRFLI